MQDDDGVLPVEIGHQGVEGWVAEVLPVAVGGQLDAVSTQHLKGITCLLKGVMHVGQGQRGAEEEASGVAYLQCGALFVVPAAHRSRGLPIAKVWLPALSIKAM